MCLVCAVKSVVSVVLCVCVVCVVCVVCLCGVCALLQAVISRASFRRLPRNGKSIFTMMSLHINNHFAWKRGIGKKLLLTVRTVMLQEHVDMVPGDFNGAAWRRQSGSDARPISIIEEAFAKTDYLVPPGPAPLWGPGGVPGEWSDVCGF